MVAWQKELSSKFLWLAGFVGSWFSCLGFFFPCCNDVVVGFVWLILICFFLSVWSFAKVRSSCAVIQDLQGFISI